MAGWPPFCPHLTCRRAVCQSVKTTEVSCKPTLEAEVGTSEEIERRLEPLYVVCDSRRAGWS